MIEGRDMLLELLILWPPAPSSFLLSDPP